MDLLSLLRRFRRKTRPTPPEVHELETNGMNLPDNSPVPPANLPVPLANSHGVSRRRYDHLRTEYYILLVVLVITLIAVIVLGVFYGKSRKHAGVPPPTVTTPALAAILPVMDSSLGAVAVTLGTAFTPLSRGPDTKVVYDNGGRICIRTKSESQWHSNAQCIEGMKVKTNSPLTILDWFGGPSIYFFTPDDYLSGIDYIPGKDSWRLSSVSENKTKVHSQSQIASVTWLNGTSSWVYYQDPQEQLREIGMDDYRNQFWRDGSVGPLAKAQPGTGIGVVRWVNRTDEIEEVFFQVLSGGIQGRMYAEKRWSTDTYGIDETPQNVPGGASLTATIISGNSSSTVLLAYVAKSGFLNVQTRETTNTTKFSAFTTPTQLIESNGHSRTGLGSVGSFGDARIIFVKDQKIFEVSNTNATATSNWNITEIGF
ncbi:MAG: hypothetical protein M1813_001818 [Trichoglossum hirsutum]|nr:MAG: hypothetical protein M1813_001818 [Trichoglossum hirsutum]